MNTKVYCTYFLTQVHSCVHSCVHSPAKPSALQVIPPTRHTASSVCCHQGGDCGVSRRGPADWRTALSIRLSGSWTPSRPCPPSPLLPHATLNSDTTPPPHQSLCAALEWSLPHPALSIIYLFWQSDNKTVLFLALLTSAQFCFVLFNWFALYLPCALCHFISFLLFFYCSTIVLICISV